ncbi:ABC-type bacteriocin/lantibiotic exporters, contain an N-terminal double-glycine peptidase domain [Hahella chejuensis KCTC 2396]|uniref:ABC-type bacteriocin/lantibiotic exporters, contain an N-terminal double-glycine peptidase domain n=2 Tax=Hahella chejuensis TaxID=158327 RepID=Q2S9A9_HAHCH|nr:ABC-type bacteriocin/lantibiotic exporters, contain an N-terminal double-glycine peptidase domain [Hahella chejuensis KCTC 2396]
MVVRMSETNSTGRLDTGLAALVMLARFHQVAADPAQIQHHFGTHENAFTEQALIRASRHLKLKAKAFTSSWEKLAHIALPAIAATQDGHYVVLARAAEDKVLIQDPAGQGPQTLSKEEFMERWSGRLILITKRSVLPGMSGKFDISWFIPAILKYKSLLRDVIIASFFIQLFALITPLFFQVIIDKVLVHKGLTTLDVLAFGLIVLSIFDVVLNGLRNYVFSHTTNRVDVTLGSKLYHHLIHLPISYFLMRQVGNTVARVRELDTIRNFITSSALTLVIDLFFTIVFFVVMYFYSPTLTWVVLGSIPFYVALSVYITPILRNRLDEKFKRGAENQAFLTESVSGMETVKAMAVEPQMQRRWEENLAAYVAASFKANNLGNIASQSAQLINKIVTVLILWIGATLVMQNELSIGQLIAFNMIAGRVSGPILKLVQLWQDFQQAGISIARLGDILNTPTEPGHNPNRTTLQQIQGQVSLENVSFRYSPDQPHILRNLSLDVKPGEVIGIVGRSGSGKSTLTKLVQRLYVPEAGRVLVDGVDLAQMEPAWLRRQVGVVLQENRLFNRSVKDNIALVDPSLPMERVIQAAKLAGAHEFIVQLPQGYDTIVGEQGASLSGGQRQRIAIARALICNPRILIFDEATSALDYESERVIQENMRHMCRGRTVFIIAHRLSTVRQADRIIVVDKGEIVESGNHDQLLQQGGYYTKLYSYQNHTPAIRKVETTAPADAVIGNAEKGGAQ